MLLPGDHVAGTGGGPAECNSPNASVFPSDSGQSVDIISFTAPAGQVITGICIKSGINMFGGTGHSGLITADGVYGENDCYTVTGMGSSTVTVTRTGTPGSNCQELSHVDYFTDPEPTPTPPTPTPPTPTPPTPTPPTPTPPTPTPPTPTPPTPTPPAFSHAFKPSPNLRRSSHLTGCGRAARGTPGSGSRSPGRRPPAPRRRGLRRPSLPW